MDDRRAIAQGEDPVCAMRLDPETAHRKGLSHRHEQVQYAFCSHACLRAFREDPAWFLDPAYTPARR